MNQITISKDILAEHGYKCWLENPTQEPHVYRKWQKCFYDDNGIKKYFVNINETFGFSTNGDPSGNNFWPSVQFDVNVPGFEDQSIEISLIQWFNESGKYSGITVPVMEQMIEEFFIKLNGIKYDD